MHASPTTPTGHITLGETALFGRQQFLGRVSAVRFRKTRQEAGRMSASWDRGHTPGLY